VTGLNSNRKPKRVTLADLLEFVKNFKGITRKSALGELLPIIGEDVYDDAGVLEVGDTKIVVSTDGIVEDLVKDDPWLAGFYSVVVNVNDVVAKGARPLGYTSVLSSSSSETRLKVVQGIKHGIEKYRLKFLKAHTHPDTSFDAIDAAVVGTAKNVMSSAAASVGDHLIVAVDLNGKFGVNGWVRAFDSVLTKSSSEVLTRLEAIIQIASEELAKACRDISGPGIIGTTAMLCESSRVGCAIDLDMVPKPSNLELQEWLITYPSTGFVLSTNQPEKCIKVLKEHGLTANLVGTVTKEKTIEISYQGQSETFMKLDEESIFGLTRTILPTRITETDVAELSEHDAAQIEALFKKVWSSAHEYPEEWRKQRMLQKRKIIKEMHNGYHYFGIKIDGKLVGLYKALITDNGLFGEHQSVDPDHRGIGLATAMYSQFTSYARKHGLKRVYVNILAGQIASRRIVEKSGFSRRGEEFEQAECMKVQTYEKLL
jgi:selenophosphate synthetase-related protein/predicted acetyltransferase